MNEAKRTVLFVHLKLRVPEQKAGRTDSLDVSMAKAKDVIAQAFYGATEAALFLFDDQSVFVEQDAGFPHIVKLFQKCSTQGVEVAISEVSPNGVTLSEENAKLKEWLAERGIRCRWVYPATA